MSNSVTCRQKSSGTDATNYPQVLERETFDHIPQSWIDAGRDADPSDDDLLFEPVNCVYVHTLHNHGSQTAPDFGESRTLIVRYRNDATDTTYTQQYRASKRDETILPTCLRKGCPKFFESTIAIPRAEVVDE